MTSTTTRYSRSAITANFGTEFTGITPDALSDPDVFADVLDALRNTHLVVIRQCPVSPQQQLELSRRIGEPVPFNIARYRHPELDEIMITSSAVKDGKPVGVARVGNFWHQDSSYLPDPPEFTLLHGVQVPDGEGDTLFASAVDVLEQLPAELRAKAEGCTATHLHSRRFRMRPEHVGLSIPEFRATVDAEYPPAVHELIKTDPDTGQRYVYGSAGYTERVDQFDANDNVRWFEAIERVLGEGTVGYRHRWSPRDIVVWKTQIAFHSATELPPGVERTMFRVSIRQR